MEGRLFFEDGLYHSVVEQVYELIKENVILTNEKGFIVASTDRSRISNFHEGAMLAIKERKKMIITEEFAKLLKGVRPGIVLPIIIDEKAVSAIGITGDPTVVQPYGLLVQKMTELFIKESMIQHNQERLAREIDFFVYDWFHSKRIDKSFIERSCFFNINLQKYNQVMLIKMNKPTLQLSYKDMDQLKQIWNIEDTLFVRWGQDKLYMIMEQIENKLLRKKIINFLDKIKELLEVEAVVGVGQPTSYENIQESYKQADLAASIATEKNPIIFEEDLRFEILLYELKEKSKAKFVERSIMPIQKEKVLLNTLEAWFDHHMSIQETAKFLHIHKNTLHYRLKKIEEVTGLSLNNVEHLSILYIGYRFLYE